MSLRHAILGFLSNQPMTGYDLKKSFDQSIQYFWPANQSQIYRTMAELTREGWVEQEVIKRDDRLDMKIYHITENGQSELHRWLATSLPNQDYREAFLIQVFFGSKVTDQEINSVILKSIKDLEESQTQLTSMYKMYQEKMLHAQSKRTLFFSMLTLEYGITSNHAAIEWLKNVHNRLQTGDHTPLDFSKLLG